jgi:hypothetical protein
MYPEENRFDLAEPVVQEISPYDVSYPVVLLSNGIKNELERAQTVAQNIYRAVVREMPALTQVQQAMDKGCRYVVDATDSTLKAIESGALKLTQENGKTYAQLRVNGKYGSKLPIKKEVFRKGIDPTQMANALQMQALQDQIQDVANQLVLIDGSVREVLQGQQNDRIGLYYSGLSLFLESRSVSDAGLRNALQAQALRALAESTFQLKLTMQSDIRYIEQKEYDKAKGKRKELIMEHMNNINQSFAFIHQATMLRAGIYCDIGEHGSMARVLEEYSYFIDNDVAKNALLLSQYDMNDDGTVTGLWASRSQLKLDTAELSRALNNPQKTLYLGVAKEESEE